MKLTKKRIRKDEFLCIAEEKNSDLYLITKGKFMVFVSQRSQVTPLAYLRPGDFVGELSYFDNFPRSAHIIAQEEGEVHVLPSSSVNETFPKWLLLIAKSLTKRIRQADELIRVRGIKRQGKTLSPLPMEDQAHYYKLLNNRPLRTD